MYEHECQSNGKPSEIACAFFAGYLYVNNSAYLIEQDGKVAVYRGLNEEFLGMPLSSLEYTSAVEVDKLNPGVANRIKEGMQVGSLEEANNLITTYQQEISLQNTTPGQTTANASATEANAANNPNDNASQRDNNREADEAADDNNDETSENDSGSSE